MRQLIAFKDTGSIKIVTGIRRCGKSSLLSLMADYLLKNGVAPNQILKINFESLRFGAMSFEQFYAYVMEHACKDKKTYLFLDEPHLVDGWEKAVNSLRVDFDCDIYITGSNSHMLSSEYSTYLSGRYVEIKMLPLSFKEFLDFRDFSVREEPSPLGGTRKRCIYKDGTVFETRELFETYLRFGGMPGLAELELSPENVSMYLDGVYNTVIANDVLERSAERGKTQINDPVLLRKLAVFLSDNVGRELSYNKLAFAINENMKLDRMQTLGNHKIQDYVEGLLEAFVVLEANRFDLKGKTMLKTNGKFYLTDMGIRSYLLGFENMNRGFALENLVYLELLSRGYQVMVGKLGSLKIDFRAVKGNEILYVQVAETLSGEETRNREFRPFLQTGDCYEKVILTLDSGNENWNGVKVLNLIDWLLD